MIGKGNFLTKLDWYIIKKMLSTFLMALALFTIIIVVFDVAEKIDEFVSKDVTLREILLVHYANYIPFLLNMFSPLFVFITVIFFTSRMAFRSEIVAILSSGVSYARFLRPYLFIGSIIACFSYYLNGYLIPISEKKRLGFENTVIRDRSFDFKQNIKMPLTANDVVSFENFRYIDSLGIKVSLEHFENGELSSRVMADKLTWEESSGMWRFHNFVERIFYNDGSQKLIKRPFKDTMIPINPDEIFMMDDDVQSFSNDEINRMIELEKERSSNNVFFYLTEKYRRIASPFSILILTLIGVCVSSVKQRGGVGLHLGKGLLISFAFLFSMQFFNSYGAKGSIQPLIAVWLPNLIFGTIAIRLFQKTQK